MGFSVDYQVIVKRRGRRGPSPEINERVGVSAPERYVTAIHRVDTSHVSKMRYR